MRDIIIDMCVVLYNPTEEQLQHISQYSVSGLFRNIYVYDNSPEKLDISCFDKKVDYHFLNRNSGLSIPYNLALRETYNNRADFLCVMDQDSVFPNAEIEKIISYININATKEIAIYCPKIVTEGTWDEAMKASGLDIIKWTINSGSFINLSLTKEFEIKYDENIFLDGVDIDFCYNVNRRGLKILRINNSKIFQSFGYTTNGSSFSKYSASRYYNISHNRKYIYKKHYGLLGWFWAAVINIRLVCRIILHEDSKYEKAKACIRGIFK